MNKLSYRHNKQLDIGVLRMKKKLTQILHYRSTTNLGKKFLYMGIYFLAKGIYILEINEKKSTKRNRLNQE